MFCRTYLPNIFLGYAMVPMPRDFKKNYPFVSIRKVTILLTFQQLKYCSFELTFTINVTSFSRIPYCSNSDLILQTIVSFERTRVVEAQFQIEALNLIHQINEGQTQACQWSCPVPVPLHKYGSKGQSYKDTPSWIFSMAYINFEIFSQD